MQRDGTGKVRTGGLSPKVSPVAACTTLVTIDTNGHLCSRGSTRRSRRASTSCSAQARRDDEAQAGAPDALRQHLQEQVAYLRESGAAFDGGDTSEAKAFGGRDQESRARYGQISLGADAAARERRAPFRRHVAWACRLPGCDLVCRGSASSGTRSRRARPGIGSGDRGDGHGPIG